MPAKLSEEIASFIVSPAQLSIDLQMVPYDVWGTMAHVVMLHKVGIISDERARQILAALVDIQQSCEEGTFKIDPGRGAQLTLEQEIVKRVGEEAGLSVHTARSRNDQIMVTEILYLREALHTIFQRVAGVLNQLIILAQANIETPMPGYTHMQPAKPTTFAHWCLAYFDSFKRGTQTLLNALEQYDMNPLGAVESFGTSWPLDRELTTELLGFEAVWEVPLDAISNRGFFQLNIVNSLHALALSGSKFASDLLLYSTFEYGFVSFGDEVAQRLHPITGSSVMAQKRNPDALELVRSIAPQVAGAYQSISGILCALPSGYNRDSREIKEHIHFSIDKVSTMLAVIEKVLASLQLNKERMLELLEKNYSLTTDLADYLSQKSGLPYRKVYKIVGAAVDDAITSGKLLSQLSEHDLNKHAASFNVTLDITSLELEQILDPHYALSLRGHRGGTNPEVTAEMCRQRLIEIKKLREYVDGKKDKITAARAKTKACIEELLQSSTIPY